MNKKTELITTAKLVKEALMECPSARNSDDVLITVVCKRINPLCATLPFETVLANRKSLGLPVFETIRRAGQKVREKHPELAGDSNVETQRELNEEVFRDYARK